MFGDNVAKKYIYSLQANKKMKTVTLPLAEENVMTQVDSNKFPLN